MKTPLLAIAVLALSACAPLPMQVYVADAQQGRLVYSTCSFNRHVPNAVDLERSGIRARVSLGPRFERQFLEVRYDVAPGTTLTLDSGRVRIDLRDGQAPRDAIIPKISRVDTPTFNYDSKVPAVQAAMLPIGAPLAGGFSGPGKGSESWKHYWVAAEVDLDGASDVWVTLPPQTIDGVRADLPEVHFERRLIIATALMNC